jgi:ferric-chelate reductase (NADPH)
VTDEGINWGDGVRPATRDYTPLYDAERHELAYDFYSRWRYCQQLGAGGKTGDKLVIGGPRGSLVVPEDYAWQLYVCDESGMPRCAAVCWDCSSFRRARRSALVTIGDESYQDYLADLDGFHIEWVVGHHSSAWPSVWRR